MQHHMLYKCTLGMFHLIVLKTNKQTKVIPLGKKPKKIHFGSYDIICKCVWRV